MSASKRRVLSASRAANARSWAPCINCQSVNGIDGTVVSTRRATSFASAQEGSTAATRATLARTAMIFAARSDPRAIVFIIRVLKNTDNNQLGRDSKGVLDF